MDDLKSDYLAQIYNALNESVQVWDTHGNALYINDKTSELFETGERQITSVNDLFSQCVCKDKDNTTLSFDAIPISRCIQTAQFQPQQTLMLEFQDHVKWVIVMAKPLFDEYGRLDAVASFMLDITRFKQDEHKLRRIVHYDPLTRLPNRSLMIDRLDIAISHANRSKSSVAVCLIDLDGFKEVNDTFGHDVGDKVLVEASKRMRDAVRNDDTVARLGGDEFVIILTDLHKSEECTISLYRLLNVLSQPYQMKAEKITSVSASIGVSVYPDDKVEADTLLRHADMAMYKSKNSGKNRFSFFDVISDQKIKANFRTINKIKDALSAQQFRLYYQPKINTQSATIMEVEALARWQHPLLGVISSDEFLPLVENDEELCRMFDRWVVSESLHQLHAWHQEELFLKVCINISPRQFKSRSFVAWLKEVIESTGVPLELLNYLEIEILVTAAVDSLTHSNEIIRECREMGITFALDGFGTGYSSLMHLNDLKVDTIKVDRLFVLGMLEQPANLVIVQAVIALANAFNISITAEGAETIEHVMSLLEMGCDAIQGYAIARPMPAEEIKGFVTQFKPDPRWRMASYTMPTKADFELFLAGSNHKYWVERALEILASDTFDSDDIMLDSNSCLFGIWLKKVSTQKYKNTASFAELNSKHLQIHDKIDSIVTLLKREHRTIDVHEADEIRILSHELLDILDHVRREVVLMKQQNDLVNKILEKRNNVEK